MTDDVWYDPNDPKQFQAWDDAFWDATRELRDYHGSTPSAPWRDTLASGVSGFNHPGFWQLVLDRVAEADTPRVRFRLKREGHAVMVVIGLAGDSTIEAVVEVPGPDLLFKPQ
ncbi:MAG: hypothetical protein M3R48_05085 [Candidatus Dormibacteraeota bacterium]|nr:hypothetical protein [Candidatus Dormibacteraeota bacterium]